MVNLFGSGTTQKQTTPGANTNPLTNPASPLSLMQFQAISQSIQQSADQLQQQQQQARVQSQATGQGMPFGVPANPVQTAASEGGTVGGGAPAPIAATPAQPYEVAPVQQQQLVDSTGDMGPAGWWFQGPQGARGQQQHRHGPKGFSPAATSTKPQGPTYPQQPQEIPWIATNPTVTVAGLTFTAYGGSDRKPQSGTYYVVWVGGKPVYFKNSAYATDFVDQINAYVSQVATLNKEENDASAYLDSILNKPVSATDVAGALLSDNVVKSNDPLYLSLMTASTVIVTRGKGGNYQFTLDPVLGPSARTFVVDANGNIVTNMRNSRVALSTVTIPLGVGGPPPIALATVSPGSQQQQGTAIGATKPYPSNPTAKDLASYYGSTGNSQAAQFWQHYAAGKLTQQDLINYQTALLNSPSFLFSISGIGGGNSTNPMASQGSPSAPVTLVDPWNRGQQYAFALVGSTSDVSPLSSNVFTAPIGRKAASGAYAVLSSGVGAYWNFTSWVQGTGQRLSDIATYGSARGHPLEQAGLYSLAGLEGFASFILNPFLPQPRAPAEKAGDIVATLALSFVGGEALGAAGAGTSGASLMRGALMGGALVSGINTGLDVGVQYWQTRTVQLPTLSEELGSFEFGAELGAVSTAGADILLTSLGKAAAGSKLARSAYEILTGSGMRSYAARSGIYAAQNVAVTLPFSRNPKSLLTAAALGFVMVPGGRALSRFNDFFAKATEVRLNEAQAPGKASSTILRDLQGYYRESANKEVLSRLERVSPDYYTGVGEPWWGGEGELPYRNPFYNPEVKGTSFEEFSKGVDKAIDEFNDYVKSLEEKTYERRTMPKFREDESGGRNVTKAGKGEYQILKQEAKEETKQEQEQEQEQKEEQAIESAAQQKVKGKARAESDLEAESRAEYAFAESVLQWAETVPERKQRSRSRGKTEMIPAQLPLYEYVHVPAVSQERQSAQKQRRKVATAVLRLPAFGSMVGQKRKPATAVFQIPKQGMPQKPAAVLTVPAQAQKQKATVAPWPYGPPPKYARQRKPGERTRYWETYFNLPNLGKELVPKGVLPKGLVKVLESE